MNFRFRNLPNGQGPFPVVDLDLVDVPGLRIPALIDSAASGVRLDAELAEALGIDVSEHSPTRLDVAGDSNLLMYRVPGVRLRIGKATWTTTAGFVSPWRHSHALLGRDGFLDRHAVRLDWPRFTVTPRRPQRSQRS